MSASHHRTARATATLQGYKMMNEEYDAFTFDGARDHDGGIRTAAEAWCEDRAAAKAKYGPIASWDTSWITCMGMLFHAKRNFNEDISRWDVSRVENMTSMFQGATSFTGHGLSLWQVCWVMGMQSVFYGAT